MLDKGGALGATTGAKAGAAFAGAERPDSEKPSSAPSASFAKQVVACANTPPPYAPELGSLIKVISLMRQHNDRAYESARQPMSRR